MSDREHLYTQKLYPVVNNDDLLEFRIPPNKRGQLDLSNVLQGLPTIRNKCSKKNLFLIGRIVSYRSHFSEYHKKQKFIGV